MYLDSIVDKISRKISDSFVDFLMKLRTLFYFYTVRRKFRKSGSIRGLIVDCGLNQGESAYRFLKFFPEFDLIGYEVQEILIPKARMRLEKFKDRILDLKCAAVTTDTNRTQYYEPTYWGKNFKGGSTIIQNKISKGINYSQGIAVDGIDFSNELMTFRKTYSFIFVKFDIEGGEYPVLEHLMKSDTLKLIDAIAIEWHSDKFKNPERDRFLDIERNIVTQCKQKQIILIPWD